ncbi:discoidin domain-containing protein [Olivibacter sitiensis]|uniref:discoidin domain-containing protein n=1 Tax=Olivibacter sitiensis TaxID=376470 RepID=UPI0004195A92|nr:discoidin domain-containing protein [Olivibacter sitiensis]
MNKRNKLNKWLLLVVLCSLIYASCKDSELEDFALQENVVTTVSAGSISGDIVKSSDAVTVPIKVSLSSPAAKAFQVGLQLNADTVNTLLEGGNLTDVAVLPPEGITVPNTVNFEYGATEAVFNVLISLSELEKFYGASVAFAYDLTNPGKGNIVGEASTGMIVFNTTDILEQEEIHYVSITKGGSEIIAVGNRQNYSVTSAGINIPLGISLAGTAGSFFTVKTAVDVDTIATLIQKGVLPANTVALSPEQYSLNASYQVGSNLSQAAMDLIVPWSTIEENADHTLALVVKLSETSRHILDPNKSYAIIAVYPQNVMEVDVTGEGTLSVDHDNSNEGESSSKLVDNDINSKFLQPDYRGNSWFQLAFEEPQFIGAYSITSANDAADRDLKDWNLQGSDDGQTWETLDTRTGETFANRFETKRYDFDATRAYKYYRINITNNNGSGVIQVAEWRLIRVP